MVTCRACKTEVEDEDIDLLTGLCSDCRGNGKRIGRYKAHLQAHPLARHEHLAIPVTTTQAFPNYRITQIHGIVCGETIMGLSIIKTILAEEPNTTSGRATAYENEFKDAREIAISELKYEAHKMGGNCVVGSSLSYETIGEKTLMVVATGTAVTVIPIT
ncbi:MAG: YbjQ family protein [Verrucomicrobiales bacterium]|nr:YbjQ family protein [Verrucomicrobiales bacterium]